MSGIKLLKSSQRPPWGGTFIGSIKSVQGTKKTFVVRFFTAGTTTEVGKAVVPNSVVNCHVANDTTNTVSASHTPAGVHVANDTTNTVAAAAATTLATLLTLINEIKADYNAHRVSTTFHSNADNTNVVASADATNEATAVTLVNEIKADYNAHCTQATIHPNNDVTNVITTANATESFSAVTLANEIKTDYSAHLTATVSDQTTLNALLNEIKGDYNAHRASTTFHTVADATNTVTSADASNLATSLTLANEIKADYNAHRSQSGVHPYTDSQRGIKNADATTIDTCVTLAAEIKSVYNAHLTQTTFKIVVYGIAPGTYDIGIKCDHAISKKAASVVITAGTETYFAYTGTLMTGDSNDNDTLNTGDATFVNQQVFDIFGEGSLTGAFGGYPGNWLIPEGTEFGNWSVVPTARRRTY